MQTLHLCGAWVLAASLLACSSSSSPAAAVDASTDVTSDTGAGSDAGNTCVSAGFTCATVGPTSVCVLAGGTYSCGSPGESCCREYLSAPDGGFCVANVDGGVAGGQTPPPGTCAGQACGVGCDCGLLQDGGATAPPSGTPVCNCPTGMTLACYGNLNCGSINCSLGCTCSDPSTGTCDCPVDGGADSGADAGDGSVADAGTD